MVEKHGDKKKYLDLFDRVEVGIDLSFILCAVLYEVRTSSLASTSHSSPEALKRPFTVLCFLIPDQ